MKLTLSADNLLILRQWFDASYGIHDDLKSHTGRMMTLAKGGFNDFLEQEETQ